MRRPVPSLQRFAGQPLWTADAILNDPIMVPADRIAAPPSLQGGFPLLGVIGRMMIGLLFVWSGVFGIVLEWPAVPDMIAAKGLPGPVLLGIGAAGIELLGPLELFHSRLTGRAGFGPRGVLRRDGNPISRLLDAAGA